MTHQHLQALAAVIALQVSVMAQISIRLPERDLEAIERWARAAGARRSQVLTAFIREGLTRG